MARGLENKGVSALVINSESLARASLKGRDLWAEARTGRYQMVLCGPETTVKNEAFDAFIEDPETRTRLGCLIIDEIHLIYAWGPDFRKSFGTLGSLRARLPEHTVLVGLTATLEPGRETEAVIQSACFKSTYHFERRDCERRNVEIIFREIKYNVSGYEFRDLDWLIDRGLLKASDILKCIIYCESIELGHRVTLYLRSLLPPHLRKDARKIIRHMHSVYCAQCKAEGLESLYELGEQRSCGIWVTSNVLAVGIDVPDVYRSIDYPCASSLSMLLQHAGRPARGIGLHGEAIIYVKKTDLDEAAAHIKSPEYIENPLRVADISEESSGATTTEPPMSNTDASSGDQDLAGASPSEPPTANSIQSTASIWTLPKRPTVRVKKAVKVPLPTKKETATRAAGRCVSLRLAVAAHLRGACIVRQINMIYRNQRTATNCHHCSSCRPSCPLLPRPLTIKNIPAPPPSAQKPTDKKPGWMHALVKELDVVADRLAVAALQLRANMPWTADMMFMSSTCFLTSSMIKGITSNIDNINSIEELHICMDGFDWTYWDDYGSGLWKAVQAAKVELQGMIHARHAEMLAKQQKARDKKREDKKREEQVQLEQEEHQKDEEETREKLAATSLDKVKHVTINVPGDRPHIPGPSLSSSAPPIWLSGSSNVLAANTSSNTLDSKVLKLVDTTMPPDLFYAATTSRKRKPSSAASQFPCIQSSKRSKVSLNKLFIQWLVH
ncbi:hypothetical protein HWV62_19595 [Athelia sp. TMB]|nr:hypothetical protein HWV62_19595 [Athelia sp. TMB]